MTRRRLLGALAALIPTGIAARVGMRSPAVNTAGPQIGDPYPVRYVSETHAVSEYRNGHFVDVLRVRVFKVSADGTRTRVSIPTA